MAHVHLRYWAGAKAAAGVAEETLEAATVREALDLACAARPGLARVVAACSLLVDGLAARPGDLERPLGGPVRVEVLPPFAGGSTPGRTGPRGERGHPAPSRIPDTGLMQRDKRLGRGASRPTLTG